MNVSDPTQRFSDRVENYIKYRPSYPPEVIAFLEKKGNLVDNAIVADIGSGTGIFTALLLQKGYTVYAVEPNDAMQSAAISQFKNNKISMQLAALQKLPLYRPAASAWCFAHRLFTGLMPKKRRLSLKGS